MQNLVRREIIETARTIVVKIGTNVLSRDDDTLDHERIAELAGQIHAIRESGRQVVLVSSGAVAAGLGLLGLASRPRDLSHLQASAAAGQAHLIRVYDDCLRQYGYHAAQLLLTANDFKQRTRYLNVRNTLHALFEYGAVPIVNENDTVSVDEIKFGDNDHLAAMVTHLVEAPLLVILSVVDGLYAGDPGDPQSERISLVETWDDALFEFVSARRTQRGTGGMRTKLEAVRKVTRVGENAVLADGRQPQVLENILAGREVGTLFLAAGSSLPAWKRWIGFTVPPRGRYVLDEGAHRAIEVSGRSLLAIGITAVEGDFAKGEVVSLVDATGREIARGLTNYNARDARALAGRRTDEFGEILGSLPYAEVVHRDNLVVTR